MQYRYFMQNKNTLKIIFPNENYAHKTTQDKDNVYI